MASRRRFLRRRRSGLVALVALVVTVIFVDQVIVTAKNSPFAEVTKDKSAGTLATLFSTRLTAIDAQLATVMETPPATRLAARVSVAQIFAQLDDARALADHLSPPNLAGGLGDYYADVAGREVTALTQLTAWWASTYHLSARNAPAGPSPSDALSALGAARREWDAARGRFAQLPGHPHLPTQVFALVSLGSAGLAAASQLWNASPLAVTPQLAIAAVLIDPQPLPTSSTAWIIPASVSVDIAVSVRDLSDADQFVSWRLTLTPTNHVGTAVNATGTGLLRADGALALRDAVVNVTPGEVAQLSIEVTSRGGVGDHVKHQLEVIGTPPG